MPSWMVCHAKEPDRDAAQQILSRIVVLNSCYLVPPSEYQSGYFGPPPTRTYSRVPPGMRRRRLDLPCRSPHSPSARRSAARAAAHAPRAAILPLPPHKRDEVASSHCRPPKLGTDRIWLQLTPSKHQIATHEIGRDGLFCAAAIRSRACLLRVKIRSYRAAPLLSASPQPADIPELRCHHHGRVCGYAIL